jgi:hypothetical protein
LEFLELTSYIGDPQGYADFPSFKNDVWPLIKSKAKEIESVFLFRNDSSSNVGWLGRYEIVTQNIIRIGYMDELTNDELSKIEHWSFYGGHLNVLYRVSTESPLLEELCSLYPVVKLSSEDTDQIGLGQESLTELQAFTAASPRLLHFSFAHDADPLCIFGDLERLRSHLHIRE